MCEELKVTEMQLLCSYSTPLWCLTACGLVLTAFIQSYILLLYYL